MGVNNEDLANKNVHRRGWIDYARGFVIIYVVYRHAMIGLISSGIHLKNAIYLVQEASMPVFFIVSGIFIGTSTAKRGLSEFVKFKFNSLLYPYFIWGFIHLSIQILFNQYSNSHKDSSYYLYLLIAPRAIDQFWYLYALFMVMIIFSSLNLTFLKFKWLPNILVAISFFVASFFVSSLWFSITDVLLYYLFLVFGFLLSEIILPVTSKFFNGKWLWYAIPFFIIIQLFWWTHYSDIMYLNQIDFLGYLLFIPITTVGALILFLISYQLDKWGSIPFLKYIGSQSLYIYIMHLIFTAASRVVLIKVLPELPPLAMLLIIIIIGVFMPIVIYRLCIRLKLHFLFEAPNFKRLNLFGSKPQ
ncbi:MAG: acyltransferase [Cyclobacteriaceae bacterium]|nr:acyltransferase [Cyclobacteriaceae bacterium]